MRFSLKFLTLSALALLIIASAAFPARAAASAPLLIGLKGDIWAWDGQALQKRTNYGNNFAPILSPDGTHIAYGSTAQGAVDNRKLEGGHSGADPTNIYVLTVANNNAIRIAEQPADAVYRIGEKAKFTLRSTPSWSPDSKAVAWTQFLYNSSVGSTGTMQLVVYDLATQKSRVIVDDIPQAAGEGGSTLDPSWGAGGIAIVNSLTVNPSPTDFATDLTVYAPDGTLIAHKGFKVDQSTAQTFWINDSGKNYIAHGAYDSASGITKWSLFDPATPANLIDMNGVPEMYSVSAPNGATIYEGAQDSWFSNVGGLPSKVADAKSVYYLTSAFAISPDGQQIAYVNYEPGTVTVAANGKSSIVAPDSATAVVWGATAWRVRHQ